MLKLSPIDSSYHLESVLRSHGWSELTPFRVTPDFCSIEFVISGKNPLKVQASQTISKKIKIQTSHTPTTSQVLAIRRVLGLDLDLGLFYELAKKNKREWIPKYGMGRLLRSETVFEDLIKLILTTNCTWSLTVKMVSNLCQDLGVKTKFGPNLFPTPFAMARKSEKYYRENLKTGYRSPYLIDIAKKVGMGTLDLESWEKSKDPKALYREMLSLPGVGPYVAQNMMRFLGYYTGLGLDSWVRATLQKKMKKEKPPKDSEIEKKYKKFEPFQGLMLWCDVTKDWHVAGDSRLSKLKSL